MHIHRISTDALLRLIKPTCNVSSKIQANKLIQTNKLVKIKTSEKSLTIIKPIIVLTKVEPPYLFHNIIH